MYAHAQMNGSVDHPLIEGRIAKRLRETFLLHSSIDTILPDSINRYDNKQLPCSPLHSCFARSKRLGGPACEYDVLAPLKPGSVERL